MTNIGGNLKLLPTSKVTVPQSGAPSLLGNKAGAPSFFNTLQKMPETMQKVAHAIEAKTEADLNHGDQLALKIFLARMQKEFGVKPDQIVQAFSKLSVHDMSLPPEDTAEKLVSQLKLNGEDWKKARNLYSKLLAILSANGVMKKRIDVLSKKMDQNFSYLEGKKPVVAPPLASRSVAAAQKSQQHSGTNAALGATAVVAGALTKSATAAGSNATPATNATSASNKSVLAESAKTEHTTHTALSHAIANQSPSPKLSAAHVAKQNLSTDSHLNAAATSGKPEAVAEQTLKPTQQSNLNTANLKAVNIKPVAINPAHIQTPSPVATAATAGATAAVAAHAKSANFAAYNQQGNGSSGGDDKQKQNQAAQAPMMADSTIAQKPDALSAAQVQAQGAKGDAAKVVQNNVKEIISHAQFLAHKGGGEMKVSLKPDGLGEVKLHVKMEKGQMTVQMLASNDDAKNMLQKGLGELKTSLAAHHIHVDTIRVDSPTDMVGQFLQHRHQQMEQQFQRRFLSNFQQRNDQNRHSMFDLGSPETPFSQVTDRASNARYAIASNGKRSARRLDLVA